MEKKLIRNKVPLVAFVIATLAVLYFYMPILAPLLNKNLEFCYRDFSSIAGVDTLHLRELSMTKVYGYGSLFETRAFLLFKMIYLAEPLGFSDAMLQSMLVIISILVGCCGIYLLSGLFMQNMEERGILVFICILFYFLNLWCIVRMIYIWIWYAYCVFPMSLFLGLKYINEGNRIYALIYAIIISIFGIFPHPGVYFLITHAMLAAYSIIIKDKKWAFFAIVPIVVYLLTNLPIIITIMNAFLGYPARTDLEMLNMFSRYGEPFNIFSMSNNWWPQISAESILKNGIFLISSAGFMVAALYLFLISNGRIKKQDRILIAFCLLVIALIMFNAQGNNNPIIKIATGLLDKIGKTWILGPFRDWGRLVILIPQLIVLIWIVCFPKLKSDEKCMCILFLIFFVAINIYSSPGREHLDRIFSAVQIPQEYYDISQLMASHQKTLWIAPNGADANIDTKYIWNPNKVGSWMEIGGISKYSGNLYGHMRENDAPRGLLNNLNIAYVIKQRDLLEYSHFSADYSWLECSKMEFFTVCKNNETRGTFRIYAGTVLVSNDSEEIYDFARIGQDSYAPSSRYGRHTMFSLAYDGMKSGGGLGRIYFIEAARDLEFEGRVVEHREGVFFMENGTAHLKVEMAEGDYMLEIDGDGNYAVLLEGEEIATGNGESDSVTTGPLHILPGTRNITVNAGEGSSLESISIYPSNMKTDMGNDAAEITGFSIEPDHAVVKISAKEPFLLSFAEDYSNDWEATVWKGGKLEKTIMPVILYGTINGFWIEATGDELVIRIDRRSKAQEMFDAGKIVSDLTLLACIFYIAYSMAKRRGAEDG